MGPGTEGAADKRFGRYRVIAPIGAGAMGAVYRARDDSLGRDVAVKTVHVIGRSEFQSEMFRARFDQEARAVAALSHPNIVPVFDVGIADDTPFLVMELVEGPSLAERIDRQQLLAPAEASALGQQIAGALGAAHARGIVHRDVKPGNILETERGVWKLADFGVAHVPDSRLTLTGQFLGSPAYAAPEAVQRGDLGPASDVYSLGATLYEGLAGTPPYGPRGVLSEGALSSHAGPTPIGALCPAVPEHLARGIMGALARDPVRRLTAHQLIAVLGGAPSAAAPPRRRGGTIALAIALLVVGIILGAALSSDDPTGDPRATPAASPSWERRAGEPPEHVRDKNAFQWSKVDEKLRDDKPGEALEHLDEILHRDPYDEEALELYREISGEDWEDAHWD